MKVQLIDEFYDAIQTIENFNEVVKFSEEKETNIWIKAGYEIERDVIEEDIISFQTKLENVIEALKELNDDVVTTFRIEY